MLHFFYATEVCPELDLLLHEAPAATGGDFFAWRKVVPTAEYQETARCTFFSVSSDTRGVLTAWRGPVLAGLLLEVDAITDTIIYRHGVVS